VDNRRWILSDAPEQARFHNRRQRAEQISLVGCFGGKRPTASIRILGLFFTTGLSLLALMLTRESIQRLYETHTFATPLKTLNGNVRRLRPGMVNHRA
jgi:hypothetical protein